MKRLALLAVALTATAAPAQMGIVPGVEQPDFICGTGPMCLIKPGALKDLIKHQNRRCMEYET